MLGNGRQVSQPGSGYALSQLSQNLNTVEPARKFSAAQRVDGGVPEPSPDFTAGRDGGEHCSPIRSLLLMEDGDTDAP
jgi:hypothetical protein